MFTQVLDCLVGLGNIARHQGDFAGIRTVPPFPRETRTKML